MGLADAPPRWLSLDVDAPPDRAHGDSLLQYASAFMISEVLFAAMRLRVAEALCEGPMTELDAVRRVGMAERTVKPFFDTLVALGIAECTTSEAGLRTYTATPLCAQLNASSPDFLGGFAMLCDTRLKHHWTRLDECLRTGIPQNEAAEVDDYYSNLTASPQRMRVFASAMTALSDATAQALATLIDWSGVRSLVDLGGAAGHAVAVICARCPTLRGVCLDLPEMEPFFSEVAARHGVEDRLVFQCGNFFDADDIPRCDVAILGNVLHNWGAADKRTIVENVYNALPPEGKLIVYETLVDEGTPRNLMGHLMNLNMLLCTRSGSELTPRDAEQLLRDAGFECSHAHHTSVGFTAVVAEKRS